MALVGPTYIHQIRTRYVPNTYKNTYFWAKKILFYVFERGKKVVPFFLGPSASSHECTTGVLLILNEYEYRSAEQGSEQHPGIPSPAGNVAIIKLWSSRLCAKSPHGQRPQPRRERRFTRGATPRAARRARARCTAHVQSEVPARPDGVHDYPQRTPIACHASLNESTSMPSPWRSHQHRAVCVKHRDK